MSDRPSSWPVCDEASIARLRERITSEYGLLSALDEQQDMHAAVGDVVRQHGASLEEIYYRPRLLEDVAGLLTIAETYFFRHPAHFDFLAELVSARLAALPADEAVNIWSAGCATGEEPYSAAIMLNGALGSASLQRVCLRATDISVAALAKAQAGVYSPWSFRETPAWVVAGYFRETGSGAALLDGPAKRAVAFERAGLMQRAASLPSESIDVVFFRNVGIYWSHAAVESFFVEVARILKPNGALLLGPSDPVPREGFVTARGLRPTDSTILWRRPSEPPSESGTRSQCRPRPPSAAPTTVSRRSPVAGMPAEVDDALGNAWAVDQALHLASALIAAKPASAQGYLIRGQLELGRARNEEAIRNLRSAVFLKPDALLARYWYACALVAAGAETRAEAQLREIERRLAALPPSAPLEDCSTRGADLLEAVRLLRRGTA